jgi:chromosomal replication initiator protein
MNPLWNTCLSILENEVSASDFSTWIRPLQAEEENKQIKLLAPNRFVLDWVKEHYFDKIEQTVQQFSNGDYVISLAIGTKNNIEQPLPPSLKNTKVKTKQPNFINLAFTFDNFVEGKSNQLARAASIQVSENVGNTYNPLLIYGSSGLGKTHLMHAIGAAILKKKPSANIIYLHSEKFVQDMVKALQQNSINSFKNFTEP